MVMATPHDTQRRLESRGLCRINKTRPRRQKERERVKDVRQSNWSASPLSLRAASRFWNGDWTSLKYKRDGAREIGDLTAVKAHYHAVAGWKNGAKIIT